MAPFFQSIKSFADVPITDKGVDTPAFLKASEGVVHLFKILQSPAFTPVVNDISGNITKVRTRYLSHPTQSTTLELLTLNEQREQQSTATDGLLWLLRGLSFTHRGLHTAQTDPNIELAAAFAKGYEVSLMQHHNVFVRAALSVAMRTFPPRREFYAKLASDPERPGNMPVAGGRLDGELNRWLGGLDRIISRMRKVYKERGYGEI